MSTTTENLELTLLSGEDNFNTDVIMDNFGKIDKVIGEIDKNISDFTVIPESDFLTRLNISSFQTCQIIQKNGKIIMYITAMIDSGTSQNTTLFTIKEPYRPISKFTLFSARSIEAPYLEKGSVWINNLDGSTVAYGNFNSGESIYICGEYTI